jgi:hypothetical protein
VFYAPNSRGVDVPNIILLNAYKERLEFPELKQKAYDDYKYWEPDSLIIEAKAAGALCLRERHSKRQISRFLVKLLKAIHLIMRLLH